VIDNSWIALGTGDGTIIVYDIEEEREIKRFVGHQAGISSLAALKEA